MVLVLVPCASKDIPGGLKEFPGGSGDPQDVQCRFHGFYWGFRASKRDTGSRSSYVSLVSSRPLMKFPEFLRYFMTGLQHRRNIPGVFKGSKISKGVLG